MVLHSTLVEVLDVSDGRPNLQQRGGHVKESEEAVWRFKRQITRCSNEGSVEY